MTFINAAVLGRADSAEQGRSVLSRVGNDALLDRHATGGRTGRLFIGVIRRAFHVRA
jgi:hypothetical protein